MGKKKILKTALAGVLSFALVLSLTIPVLADDLASEVISTELTQEASTSQAALSTSDAALEVTGGAITTEGAVLSEEKTKEEQKPKVVDEDAEMPDPSGEAVDPGLESYVESQFLAPGMMTMSKKSRSGPSLPSADDEYYISNIIRAHKLNFEDGKTMTALFEISSVRTKKVVTYGYCVERSVNATLNESGYKLGDWKSSGISNLGLVAWKLHHAFPKTTEAEMGNFIGIDKLTKPEAISIAQAAIWNSTDGAKLEEKNAVSDMLLNSKLDKRVFAGYKFLNENATEMAEPQPQGIQIEMPESLPVAEKMGPIRVTSEDGKSVNVKVTHSQPLSFYYGDGKKVDFTQVVSGKEFFAIPESVTEGSLTLEATSTATIPSGMVFTKAGAQTIISATQFQATTTVSKTMKWCLAKTDITGKKVWHGPNGDKVAKIILLANGQPTGDFVEVKEGEDKEFAFKNKPVYGKSFFPIDYNLGEESIDGYEVNIFKGNDGKFVITNTFVVKKVDIAGKKVWHGPKGDKKAIIRLLANGQPTGDFVEVKEGENKDFVFKGKPTLDDKYQPITYSLSEDPIQGYKTTITTDKCGKIVITNDKKNCNVNISGKKVWEGPKGSKTTKIHLLANGKPTGDFVEVTEGEDKEFAFKNKPSLDASYSPINYSLKEDAIDGYATTIVKGSDGKFVVTNRKAVGSIDINGKKIWKGPKGNKITKIYLLANEQPTGDFVEVKEGEDKEFAFKNKPELDNKFQKIAYTLTESAIEGYKTIVATDNSGVIVVTNEMVIPTVNIIGDKVWEGPVGGLTTKIYLLANGEKTGDFVEVTEGRNLNFEFKDKPVLDDKYQKITYTLSEDPLEAYVTKITQDEKGRFTVLNSKLPSTGGNTKPQPSDEGDKPPKKDDKKPSSPGIIGSGPAVIPPDLVPGGAIPKKPDPEGSPFPYADLGILGTGDADGGTLKEVLSGLPWVAIIALIAISVIALIVIRRLRTYDE